jgi:hypothetical protein
MPDEMMSLRTLLEKSSDAELLREMVGFAAQRLMELEVEGLTARRALSGSARSSTKCTCGHTPSSMLGLHIGGTARASSPWEAPVLAYPEFGDYDRRARIKRSRGAPFAGRPANFTIEAYSVNRVLTPRFGRVPWSRLGTEETKGLGFQSKDGSDAAASASCLCER